MLLHGQLGFDNSHRFEGNANNNQDGGASQCNICACKHGKDDRKHRNQSQEQRSYHSNLPNNASNKFRSWFSRTDTGNDAIVLPEVIGNLNGIILNRNIKEVKRNNQNKVDARISPAVIIED